MLSLIRVRLSDEKFRYSRAVSRRHDMEKGQPAAGQEGHG